MWYLLPYILYRFSKMHKFNSNGNRRIEIPFKEFSKFIFDVLWRRYAVVFHDSKEDLINDLNYLNKLDLIKFDGNKIIISDIRLIERFNEKIIRHKLIQDNYLMQTVLKRVQEATIT